MNARSIVLSLAAISALLLPSAGLAQEDADTVVIQQSRGLISKSNQVQRLTSYINIDSKQQKLPLRLQVVNGDFNNAGFEFAWLRGSIGGRQIFTEKDFNGKSILELNVSGRIGSGPSQFIITGAGKPGATVQWSLLTNRVSLNKINPDPVIAGDDIELTGRNFAPAPGITQVLVGSTALNATLAENGRVVAKIPENMQSGKYETVVSVGGVKSNSIMLKVLGAPVLTDMHPVSGPPSQDLIINGRNFSTKPGETKVYFGSVEAEIFSITETTIHTNCPAMEFNVYDVPVYVKVGKVKSKNSMYFNVQRQVY